MDSIACLLTNWIFAVLATEPRKNTYTFPAVCRIAFEPGCQYFVADLFALNANQMGCSGIEVLMVAVMKGAELPTQAEFHAAISSRSDRWYSACLRITRSPELAEDAVQEALLSAWAKRHQFNHTARLETWIHRIAVNAALQLLRKNRPGDLRAAGDRCSGQTRILPKPHNTIGISMTELSAALVISE